MYHLIMKQKYAIILLLITSLIWGFAFVAQSAASDTIGAFTFNGLRFIIGSAVLAPIAIFTLKKNHKGKEYKYELVRASIICGILLASASMFQQTGIEQGASSGKAGFITSLYILFVPVLSLLQGNKISRKTWICVAAGILGAYLISASGNSYEGQLKGELLVLVSAFLFALHIIAIERLGKGLNGIELSFGQYITAGIICSAAMLIVERPELSAIAPAWISILYAGAFSCGVAYTLQVIGQKYVAATPATLALSLESVWALIGGTLMLKERMSASEICGCIILFSAVIASQINIKKPDHSFSIT